MGAAKKEVEVLPAKKFYKGRKLTKTPARPVDGAPVKDKKTDAKESPSGG